MTIQKVREQAESRYGRKLSDEQFDKILAYTQYKAKVNGHDESYVPLLLADEIKNYLFQQAINSISREYVAVMKMLGERKCENV